MPVPQSANIEPDVFTSSACDFLADMKADQEHPLAEMFRHWYESGQAAAVAGERHRIKEAVAGLRRGWMEDSDGDEQEAVLLGEVLEAVSSAER